MAGGNAINKAKYKNKAFRHAKALGQRRAAKVRDLKLSLGRLAAKTAPVPTDAMTLAVFEPEVGAPNTVEAKRVLSKKKARKLARNDRYLAQAAGKDIEMEEKEIKIGELERVKKTLWSLVELWKPTAPTGQGTTLGA